MSLLQSLIKFRIHLPGISLTLHAGLNSYGPTDRFCIGCFVVPIVGRLRRPFVCALSPRLGFASWRSLNYFAVARHLYSSSGGVLHSTEQDESFRFDYFSHLSGGLRLRLRPPATYRLTFQVFIFRSRYDVFSGALFTECIFLRVFFRAQLACGSLYRGYP